jgi:hypothetical protein
MIDQASVIRRLTKLEVLYDDELHHNNLISTRAFLLHLAEGHRIDARLLREACTHWLKHNPLLCAAVHRTPRSNTERYFVRMDLAELLKFANVEWLETDHYFKWMEKMDREVVTPFDMARGGPLWRMSLVKINNDGHPFDLIRTPGGGSSAGGPIHFNQPTSSHSSAHSSTSDYNYVFVLSSQYTLGDEHSIFQLFTELLNIIVALLEKRKCPEMDDLSQHVFNCNGVGAFPSASTTSAVSAKDSSVDMMGVAAAPCMRRFHVKQEVNIRLKRSSALFADSDLNGRFNLNRFR